MVIINIVGLNGYSFDIDINNLNKDGYKLSD